MNEFNCKNAKIVSIYTTTSNMKEAEKIGKNLLEKRIVACVNIIPKIKSIYRWEGKIEEDIECIMFAKTRKENIEKAISEIKQTHSYEVPCIVVLPIINGLDSYLDYVVSETEINK